MPTNTTDQFRRLSDPEAEAAVLGSLLVDPHERDSVHDVFETITPDDFDDTRHSRIFRSIRAVWDQGYAIDFVTVGEDLDRRHELEEAGGRDFLVSLAERVPTSTNLLRHAEIVREHSVRRQLSRAGAEIAELAKNPPPSDRDGAVDGILDLAEKKIFEIADRGQQGTGTWLADALKPAMARIERVRDRTARHTGLETGFFDLDDLTTGFHPGQLVIVAGRPGMGKTAFALNVALHSATKGNSSVALFSMEMSHQEITNRILCSDAGIDSHALRTGRLPEDQLHLLADAAGRLNAAPIWIDDSGTHTPFTIRARSRRLRSAKRLDLVVVDYLQLVTYPGQENRVQEISAISRSLKALARELDVPVIALSQLNRSTEKEDRRPRMADLRESGSIEQDADIVILLYREEVYKKTDQNAGKAEVIIAKQRNGPTDTVTLAFDSGATRFGNLAYGRGEGR